jgi:uncharacterized membrane protein
MLVQIAILARFFLGEKQSNNGVVGLLLVTIGAVIVQIKANKSNKVAKPN